MPNLDVEGATLYYETVGDGPVLLCVTGASGTLEFWQPLAEKLKDTFTVVRYDRTSLQSLAVKPTFALFSDTD